MLEVKTEVSECSSAVSWMQSDMESHIRRGASCDNPHVHSEVLKKALRSSAKGLQVVMKERYDQRDGFLTKSEFLIFGQTKVHTPGLWIKEF